MKDPPPGACCASSAVDGQPGGGHQGALTGAAAPSGGGFDDDYNEWELGIGDLIIDLDADIEKSNDPMASSSAAASPPVEHQATVDKGLKMKIKRKNLAKHEIVKAQDTGASPPPLAPLPSTKHSSLSVSSSSSSSKSSSRSGSHKKKRIENGASPPRLQCSLGAPLPPPAPPPPPPSLSPPPPPAVPPPQAPPAAAVPLAPMEQTAANGVPSSPSEESSAPASAALPAPEEAAADATKRAMKAECPDSPAKVVAASTSVERKDSGVLCTSVGTITEPDCLGPCEPGTSVTLEGIVWQETEGGVLVVNVTWRGKTYVGTLLDCTRHDWAPPRFCESPTSDLDAKGGLPKGGRPKRARGDAEASARAAPVQGKLRNGKGRRFAVPCSPAKNEGRRRNKPPELELSPPDKKRARARSTPTPEAPCSPALILCPEPNCGKKYKHINGLRYHQSHAHGCGDAKGGEEETSDGGEEGSRPPSPDLGQQAEEAPATPVAAPTPPATAAATAVVAAAAAAAAPSPAPPLPPSPPVSVTVSIPTSQVFSFVPASAPRASTPPRPSVVCGPAPPCSPESPHASVAPPSPAKALPAIVETPPPQSDPNRPHKRPHHKKSKSRKLEGNGSVVLQDEAGPEGAPPSLAESGPPQEQAPPHLEESVQSPAYSDISDDAAPLLEAAKDKEPPRTSSELYGVYPYFGQPPYLLPGVQAPEGKPVSIAGPGSSVEEDSKKDSSGRDKATKEVGTSRPQEGKKPETDFPQFPPYSLCAASPFVQGASGFTYDPYHVHLVEPPFKEDKAAAASSKEPAADKAPPPEKVPPPPRPPLNPRRASPEPPPALTKDQLECKEEAKPEPKFSPYDSLYERRFLYLPPEQAAPPPVPPAEVVTKEVVHPPKSVVPHKSTRAPKEHKEKEAGGQKPTMETTGPPPPANYAYLHPGYLPSHFSPHMAFESVYRGLPPPYGASPYLRFHVPPPEVPPQAPGPPVAPPQGPPKALDLLHQVSQHYGNHKIHELQERAAPSPSPHVAGERPPKGGPPEKGPPSSRGVGSEGASSVGPPVVMGGAADLAKGVLGPGGGPMGPQGPTGLPPGVAVPPGAVAGAPSTATEGSRSPPPQRHLHTHHHTHVGVGYPLYDPYGVPPSPWKQAPPQRPYRVMP
ncbi:hypothetical protein V5799_019197 [Amblyomma americanum]|uniref:C2H2-type domain-containing protein n=1 Tax=Amblyomma americanum TaxID=6943 RepID=A0AAQ4EXZ6_AMBAM